MMKEDYESITNTLANFVPDLPFNILLEMYVLTELEKNILDYEIHRRAHLLEKGLPINDPEDVPLV